MMYKELIAIIFISAVIGFIVGTAVHGAPPMTKTQFEAVKIQATNDCMAQKKVFNQGKATFRFECLTFEESNIKYHNQ